MIQRSVWSQKIYDAWSRRSVVWLSGVRRAGKTTLARTFQDATYLNCDLPSTQREFADPELFFAGLNGDETLVIDEAHRLDDPGRVLKIVADQHPGVRVLAVASSTASALDGVAETLSGRTEGVHLCPVPWQECLGAFGVSDLDRRLLHGGLPEPLLATDKDPEFFGEWIDTFYARDILALFNTRNRRGFLALFRALLRESGGQVDYGRLASMSGQSRPTVGVHLEQLRAVEAIHLVRPFHGKGSQEIVSRPKCYAFDTGFIAFERGWRDGDRSLLWEHLVLDALRLRFPETSILYWRDKSRREVDFVIRRGTGQVDLVECEIDPYALDPGPTRLFRSRYATGENFIVTPAVSEPYRIRHGPLTFTVCSTAHLASI